MSARLQAHNGIIIGSVRYAFVNGDGMWCIAIQGHKGEPPWTMPVMKPASGFQPEHGEGFPAMGALMSEPPLSLPLLTKEKPP